MQPLEIRTATGIRKVGPGYPTFIVAELSANHAQDFQRALKIIDGAAVAGVDALKLQTYTADTLTIDCDNEYFQIKADQQWAGKTLYQLYQEAYTPWEWHPKLKEYAESKGLIVFSTPFDETAVDFLESLDVPLYKVASFMTANLELLAKIGKTKKPVIIARGLTPLDVLEQAIATLKQAGTSQIAVLHCISSYPAKPEQMNLKTIPDIMQRFKVVAGLSDHSLEIPVSIAAVALGGSIIEKHLTNSRQEFSHDSLFSHEPHEMQQLVHEIRIVEAALGKATYDAVPGENTSIMYKQSLFVVADIQPGEPFTRQNIRVIRPGFGLASKNLNDVLGKKANKALKRGTPLSQEDIS